MKKSTKESMVAWGQVLAAAGTFMIAIQVYQTSEQVKRTNKLTSLESARAWNERQPPNAHHCLRFMASLGQEDFNIVANREALKLKGDAKINAKRCLADVIEGNNDVITGDALTEKGSSMISERVKASLNSDELVIRLHKNGLGDGSIVDLNDFRITIKEDAVIVAKLSKLPQFQNRKPYPEISRFICEENPNRVERAECLKEWAR